MQLASKNELLTGLIAFALLTLQGSSSNHGTVNLVEKSALKIFVQLTNKKPYIDKVN